jgi:flagellar biosynthesis/type III secretory pathway ATPase
MPRNANARCGRSAVGELTARCSDLPAVFAEITSHFERADPGSVTVSRTVLACDSALIAALADTVLDGHVILSRKAARAHGGAAGGAGSTGTTQ